MVFQTITITTFLLLHEELWVFNASYEVCNEASQNLGNITPQQNRTSPCSQKFKFTAGKGYFQYVQQIILLT